MTMLVALNDDDMLRHVREFRHVRSIECLSVAWLSYRGECPRGALAPRRVHGPLNRLPRAGFADLKHCHGVGHDLLVVDVAMSRSGLAGHVSHLLLVAWR